MNKKFPPNYLEEISDSKNYLIFLDKKTKNNKQFYTVPEEVAILIHNIKEEVFKNSFASAMIFKEHSIGTKANIFCTNNGNRFPWDKIKTYGGNIYRCMIEKEKTIYKITYNLEKQHLEIKQINLSGCFTQYNLSEIILFKKTIAKKHYPENEIPDNLNFLKKAVEAACRRSACCLCQQETDWQITDKCGGHHAFDYKTY
ncbi:MAG: hypothetical protein WC430_01430 [Patescibacteria group bacterium]